MGLPPYTVLHVFKPLYGIPEAGLHWYLTYLSHHIYTLGMTKSRYDPYLLMKHRNIKHIGMTELQVDDSL